MRHFGAESVDRQRYVGGYASYGSACGKQSVGLFLRAYFVGSRARGVGAEVNDVGAVGNQAFGASGYCVGSVGSRAA